MSDTAELQFIYAPQTHIINTSFQKQQPPSKLVNRYLSSAAQYLNRTKSFHVPSTNNHSRQYISSNNTINDNLAQSMQNINPRTTIKITSNDLSMSINESNSSTLPLNCNNNNNSINGNKPQGFVNTLRRSLRKNKERFYNKRAATMKSCHSLNTYEQPMNDHQDIHMKISMTPTLFSRRQHLTDSLRNTVKDNNNNKSDQRRKKNPKIILFTMSNVTLIYSFERKSFAYPCKLKKLNKTHKCQL
jgi:hypothetical protein